MVVDATASDELLNLTPDELMPDPSQPRKTFLDDEIARLAASIQARGILQPLRVLFDPERKKYRIIIGESRWHAAKLAGLATLPCLPISGQPSEADILYDQISENTARHALSPLQLARAISRLKSLDKCSGQQLAAKVGLSPASVSKLEAILMLPPAVQAMVESGRVTGDSAYHIARLHPDTKAMLELAEEMAEGKITRDALAEAVQRVVGKKKTKSPSGARLPLRLDGGVNVTISAAEPLTWESFNAAMTRIRREAKALFDAGRELTELATLLNPK